MSAPRIVLGVCGGIGAYKSAEVLRGLQKAGADVTVAMTRHAAEFITPLTMQTLSGRPVAIDLFDLERGSDIEHIELVRRTDLLVIAPATANMLGKLASGVADDFLSTFYTAVTCPVLIAPAMNTRMWTSWSVQDSVRKLLQRSVAFVEPESGRLACGEEGEGRLASTEAIVAQALRLARRGRSLEDLRAIVTAGPTREPIDPVRYVSNRSSGKMGYAIAAALARRGARVDLISGPTSLPAPYGVKRIDVETAAEMSDAVSGKLRKAGALWMVAAVADFRPRKPAPHKLGKRGGRPDIEWEPTDDILAAAGARKKGGQVLVGFAAETEELLKNARRKMREKNLDFIVANDVTRPGAGFESDSNAVTVLRRQGGRPIVLDLASKDQIAERLVDLVHGSEAAEVSLPLESTASRSRPPSPRRVPERGSRVAAKRRRR